MKGNATLRLWWPRRAALYGWGFFVPPSISRSGTRGRLATDDLDLAVMAAAIQGVLRD